MKTIELSNCSSGEIKTQEGGPKLNQLAGLGHQIQFGRPADGGGGSGGVGGAHMQPQPPASRRFPARQGSRRPDKSSPSGPAIDGWPPRQPQAAATPTASPGPRRLLSAGLLLITMWCFYSPPAGGKLLRGPSLLLALGAPREPVQVRVGKSVGLVAGERGGSSFRFINNHLSAPGAGDGGPDWAGGEAKRREHLPSGEPFN